MKFLIGAVRSAGWEKNENKYSIGIAFVAPNLKKMPKNIIPYRAMFSRGFVTSR